MTTTDHEAFVREYLQAIESGATGEALARFFTPDVTQEEFPNRLQPEGVTRNLSAILAGAERGQGILQRQEFSLHSVVSSGSTAVAEVTWTGAFSVPIGDLQPGSPMRARFCIVLELEGGRIRAQRNYDCYYPF